MALQRGPPEGLRNFKKAQASVASAVSLRSRGQLVSERGTPYDRFVSPPEHPSLVTVELYGVPRLRAGRGEVLVQAAELSEAIAALEEECPGLRDAVIQGGRLLSAYRVSLNGRDFVSDPATRLRAGDRLVLVAADAGG